MAKTKPQSKSAQAPAAVLAPEPARWWPEEFLAPAPTGIILGAGLLASIIIGYIGLNNGLVGFKQAIAYLLGLSNPYDIGVPPTSMDAMAVLLGLVWTVIGAAIHPAVGLGVLALLRPWLDGYTFPTDNFYFTWGTALCFIVWGVGKVMRGGEVRAWKMTLLFAAFPALAAVLAPQSINYNETFRALVIWQSYVITFFLVANLAANTAVFRFLLAAILFSIVAQALFAVMQYRYILPFLRYLIQQDPRLLQNMFGVESPTAELARRFNINRAFGTVLFPNALAAFLITWIPLFCAGAWNNLLAWRALGAGGGAPRAGNDHERRIAFYLAFGAWTAGTVGIFALCQFPIAYALPGQAAPFGTYGAAAWSAGLALLPAAGIFALVIARGPLFALTVGRTSLYTFALFTALYTLLITFSRGGMLALASGAALGLFLAWGGPARKVPFLPAAAARWLSGTAAALAIFVLLSAQAPAPAPPEDAQPNTTELRVNPDANNLPPVDITTQGQDVALEDLASGASFRARFTYWRVGLRMFLDNPWAGVGLKCFGWAYAKYQYLGAFDVREAHNAFLQAFCEAGILGGALTLAFWGGVVLFGARCAWRDEDPARKRLFAALTAGITAFLLHSALDINFSHPTLMFFASVAAGFLFALAPAAPASRAGSFLLLPVLVIVALASGVGMRVFLQDLALGRAGLIGVSDERELDTRLAVARHFLETIPEYVGNKKQPPSIYFATAQTLIPDPQLLASTGIVYTRGADGQYRQVPPGVTVPPDALLLVKRPWHAKGIARKEVDRVVAEVEAIDRRFPYNAKIAAYLSQWYFLMVESSNNARLKPEQPKYIERMVYWAQEASRRNPWHADLLAGVASAYMRQAYYQKIDNRALYDQAWETMRAAVALAPVTKDYWGNLYGTGLELAKAYEAAGMPEKAAEYRAEARAAQQRFSEIITSRINMGIEAASAPPQPQAQPPQPQGKS